MSSRHTEALAHLIYGLTDSGGFIQLTGEVGTGKTTLIRSLLQQLPENADVALVLNPQLSRTEFLAVILEELGVPEVDNPDSIKQLHSALNQYLLENHSRGRRTVLIVDEAQNLAVDVLEQIRLLTNLETSQQKLLQITLIGQPELRQVLSRNDLRQLAQRITGRYHLEPLGKKDTTEYIQHRIAVAGGGGGIFPVSACREVFRLSSGVPRIINVICDRALLGAYTQEELVVTPALIKQAAREIYADAPESTSNRWQKPLIAAGLVATLLVGIWLGAFQADKLRPAPPTMEEQDTAAAETPEPAIAPMLSDAEPEPPEPDPVPAAQPFVPAEPAPEPVASLNEFLITQSEYTDTANAFVTLFSLWGVTYQPGPETACDTAKNYGLRCMWQQGSLAQLQTSNRPAILTLRDDAGAAHQVTLVKLTDSLATIEVAQTQLDIPVDQLLERWFGSSLLVWQPGVNPDQVVGPGDRNPAVRWLRESMDIIYGTPDAAAADPDYYDDVLAERVKEYQRNSRLDVDGLVGAQTQIAINTGLQRPDTPLLVTGS